MRNVLGKDQEKEINMTKEGNKVDTIKSPSEKTYTCYFRFDEDEPAVVAKGITKGIALELSPAPTVLYLDGKKRIKHVGSIAFSSGGKKFTIYLSEDKDAG